MTSRVPKPVVKALMLQAGVHALHSLLVGLPLAWLVRDLTVSQPGGVRALFADGGVLALDALFRGLVPLTTAESWLLLCSILLFFADAGLSTNLFRALRPSSDGVSFVRAFTRVLAARIVFGILVVGIVALFGFLSMLVGPKFVSRTDAFRDVASISGYAVGLLVTLPVLVLRDLWLTATPSELSIWERLSRVLRTFRRRFASLAGGYVWRVIVSAVLLGSAVLFVRAPSSAIVTLLLLLVSRALASLRVLVRSSFYLVTSRLLAATARDHEVTEAR